VWGVARSTVYDRRARATSSEPPKKPGPKGLTDAELVEHIRTVLRTVEEVHGLRGEGYRKVWARLRHKGIRTAQRRVLRLMREHGLLAMQASTRRRGPRFHDGTITTVLPDTMWGTDATRAWTVDDGWCWVFVAVDHCNTELVGVHASLRGTRLEALEPIHQGVRDHFGGLGDGVAAGLAVRHDHGSQYMSERFQAEMDFLGIRSSPNFVGSPEGNGVAERFIRTLKEQLLWVEHFKNVDELREALQAFRERYNDGWLVARHGYRTPSQVRERLAHEGARAA